MLKLTLGTITCCLIAGSALASEPVALTTAQMDVVTGGSFVCPVISTDGVLNSPKGAQLPSGEYTIGGPEVGPVPMRATNAGGAGTPGGDHASPGDTNYTAIWYQ